jgi:protocatechuate 3,4-dioxygenase beta subunit
MHDDDATIGRLLTRREVVALFGASSVAAMAHRISGQTPSTPAASVPACVVQPQQTEGPYFVDEKLLRSDIRSDPATGAIVAGAPLTLTMKVSQVTPDGQCATLPGAQVDLWQCDAMGAYSGVKDRLFDTAGQKFLRGHQITDEGGVVRFVTIYPGWYPGRAVHMHFKVRSTTATPAYEFTSQFYFDEQLTDRVHATEPYTAHVGQRMRNERDGIYRDGGQQLTLAVRVATGGTYAAAFDMAMRPNESPIGRGRGRGRGL